MAGTLHSGAFLRKDKSGIRAQNSPHFLPGREKIFRRDRKLRLETRCLPAKLGLVMTTAHWNQIAAAVEQLPVEKQEALAALVAEWLQSKPSLSELPDAPTGRRRAGSAAGQFVIPPEFDDPLPDEIQAVFEGRI